MTTTQPYAGASSQRLIDLINAQNQSHYQLGVDFTLGSPTPYSDAAGRNTKVILTPLNGLYSPIELHYYRLPLTVLNQLPAGDVLPVQIPGVPFTLRGILAQINTALGLNLDPSEVVDQTYSTQQPSYSLPIDESVSLAWLNSAFSFAAQFPAPAVASLFPTTSLPGFDSAAVSPLAWKVTVVGVGDVLQLTMMVVNGKLWLCDNATVKAYNLADGSVVTTLDLNAYLGVTNNVSDIMALDANGVLWLSSRSSYHTTQPSIIRIDTTTGTIKDGLFGGTYRLTNDFSALCGEGTPNYVWAIHENRDSGTVRTLAKLDIVSGAIVSEYPLAKLYDTLVYDHVNLKLWGVWSGATTAGLDVYNLDATTYAPSVIANLTTVGAVNSIEVIHPTAWDEVVALSQNSSTNLYHLTRYKATDGSVLMDVDLSDPRLNPNTQTIASVSGPIKYNPITDEIYLTVSHQATPTDTDLVELWAFKRMDLSFSRIVAAGDVTGSVWDYAISNGSTYVLYDSTTTLAKLTQG